MDVTPSTVCEGGGGEEGIQHGFGLKIERGDRRTHIDTFPILRFSLSWHTTTPYTQVNGVGGGGITRASPLPPVMQCHRTNVKL